MLRYATIIIRRRIGKFPDTAKRLTNVGLLKIGGYFLGNTLFRKVCSVTSIFSSFQNTVQLVSLSAINRRLRLGLDVGHVSKRHPFI
jgi:hypothetical protein